MSYNPALDGMRALAILLVLALHGSLGHCPGGFIGVDIFFVLSGYLITKVLLRPGTTFKRFYLRRAQRLLPALFFTLLLARALWHFTSPDISYLRAALPVAFYVADFQAMANPALLGSMVHTWSLAIEEQFYLVWPIVLLIVMSKLAQRGAAKVLGVAATFALLRIILYFLHPTSVGYFSPFTRIDVLLVGCGTALAPNVRRFKLIAWVFLAAVPVLVLTLQQYSPAYFLAAIPFISVGSAALIGECLSSGDSLIKNILSYEPLVWIGRRSYGIYLYHPPIFAALESFRRPHDKVNFLMITCVRIAMSLFVAAMSFKFIEWPILSMRAKGQRLSEPG